MLKDLIPVPSAPTYKVRGKHKAEILKAVKARNAARASRNEMRDLALRFVRMAYKFSRQEQSWDQRLVRLRRPMRG